MAALILTLGLTSVLAGLLWLILGARLKLAIEPQLNNWLNLVGYGVLLLPLVFVLVFYLVEKL